MLKSATLLALTLALSSCVNAERTEMMAAKADLEQCYADHSEETLECAPLEERLDVLQQNYEARARQVWGCSPVQEECPEWRNE